MDDIKENLITIAKTEDTAARHELLKMFLKFQDDFIKEYKGKGVPDEDLKQECALVISEEILSKGFLEKEKRAERILQDKANVDTVFAELIHDISTKCEKALINLTESESLAHTAAENVLSKVNVVNDAALAFKEEYGFPATPDELTEYCGLTREEIIEAVELSGYEIKDIDFNVSQ